MSWLRRLSDADRRVLVVLLLTVGTGAVDAVSYVALDRVFTANMSGNIALLGIGLATTPGHVAGNIYAFVGFVVGSIVAGRLIREHGGHGLRTVAVGLVAELALLVALVLTLVAVDVAHDAPVRYAVCGVLAAAMALQTGLARHLGVTDVNTTVATMTLHGLAADSRLAGGDSTRWRRRLGVVLGLLCGAAIGIGLDQITRWAGLAFTAVVVAAAMRVAFWAGDAAAQH